MRNLQILLAFGLLACIAHATSLGGYSNITIYGNEDPGACQLTLTMTVQATQVVFNESVWNPLQDCTYQNLQFANAFRSDALGGYITLAQQNGSSNYVGTLNMSDVNNTNGTYCGLYGDNGAGDWYYVCRFKYGSVYFSVGLFVNQNTSNFDTNYTDLIFPDYGSTNLNSANGQNLLTQNRAFPSLVGVLRNNVSSWSTVVSNLSQPIYVQGTVLVSNTVNLTLYLSNFVLNAIALKAYGSSNYSVYKPASQVYPFTNATQLANNVSNINLTWGQVLSNLSQCVNGCDVVMILQNGGSVYILGTTGITTVAPVSTNTTTTTTNTTTPTNSTNSTNTTTTTNSTGAANATNATNSTNSTTTTGNTTSPTNSTSSTNTTNPVNTTTSTNSTSTTNSTGSANATTTTNSTNSTSTSGSSRNLRRMLLEGYRRKNVF